jgi:hypothetical protein
MRTKKETRSLLPGVRRLLSLLAEAHPMIVAITLTREDQREQDRYHRNIRPRRD